MDWIEWLKYAVLGLVQGFTEPIPVSSSGHLVIAERLFGLHIEGLGFEVLVNFASLLAILLIYRKDIVRLTVNTFRFLFTRAQDAKDDFMFVIYLILATIPAGIIGVVFKDTIADVFKGVKIIGATLLVTALALWLIRNLRGRKGDKDLSFGERLSLVWRKRSHSFPALAVPAQQSLLRWHWDGSRKLPFASPSSCTFRSALEV